ncbi:MAG: DUF4149 domain-containing protein [Deltaproteobacteria bacterium]|nr:MAG: DUF4149 domain-containing protein [Deltaproteobacteria bacterium]
MAMILIGGATYGTHLKMSKQLTRWIIHFTTPAMLLTNFIYVLSLIVWIGSIVFFSFVTAPSLFKGLPLDIAGQAVASIFPKYYMVGYVSGFTAFATLIYNSAKTSIWSPLKMFLLLVMIGMTLFAGLNIHPRARTIKEEIKLASDETEAAHLKQEFDRVHKLSVIFNGIVLLIGLLLVLLTAKTLTL